MHANLSLAVLSIAKAVKASTGASLVRADDMACMTRAGNRISPELWENLDVCSLVTRSSKLACRTTVLLVFSSSPSLRPHHSSGSLHSTLLINME